VIWKPEFHRCCKVLQDLCTVATDVNTRHHRIYCLQVPSLDDALGEKLDALDSATLMRLRRYYFAITQLSVVSLFAGSEMGFTTLVSTMEFMRKKFGHAVKCVLEWAVEKDKWKREFSHARDLPKASFDNLINLANQNFEGLDLISGKILKPIGGNMAMAGFECDTVSKIVHNQRNAASSSCLEHAAGKTGTTGRATLLCIATYKFKLTLLENSSVLGQANLEYIITYLNVSGILVWPFMLKAEKNKSPSRRERQYMICALVSPEAIDQLVEGFAFPEQLREFSRLLSKMEVGPGSPDDYILDPENPWHLDILEEWAEQKLQKEKQKDKPPAKKVAAKKKSQAEGKETDLDTCECDQWEADHLELYKDNDMSWPPKLKDEDSDLEDAVGHLQPRLQEAAYFHVHRPRSPGSALSRTFHDLQPTLRFGSEIHDQVNTIVCTSTILDRLNKRVLTGIDLMLLQGYPVDKLIAEALPNNAQLTEMAGNAFNAWALQTIFTALLGSGLLCFDEGLYTSGLPKGEEAKQGHSSDADVSDSMDQSEEEESESESAPGSLNSDEQDLQNMWMP